MTMIAITRQVSPGLGACELTYMDRGAIDPRRAARQHAAYENALRAMGAEVVSLPPEPGMPDCCFVEDTALVLEGVAVLARMRRASRAPEVALVERLLSSQREIARINPPGTLEGGDAFLVDRTIFVGLSTRTNEAGVSQLRAIAEPIGYTVVAVPVTGCLHLTTGASWLGDRRVLANPAWIDTSPISAAGAEVVAVHPDEPWAANTLRLNARTLVGGCFPRTREIVGSLGVETDAVDISELMKAEAGLTCMSLLFEGAPAPLHETLAGRAARAGAPGPTPSLRG